MANELNVQELAAQVGPGKAFYSLGLVGSEQAGTLTFLDDARFVDELRRNPCIAGVITSRALASTLVVGDRTLAVFVSDDPRYDFYSIQNALTDIAHVERQFPSVIDPSAAIHPRAYVAEHNVRIGPRVLIQANATILPDVEIGEDSIIRAGTVVGAEGFEHKRTSKGVLSVKHDGQVRIGRRVDVGANCAISKGFGYRQTLIGDDTKLDNLVHVAHGVQIGQRCMLPAACMIAGSVTLGDDVWIGPNATVTSQIEIGPGAYVTLGAVVTRSIGAGERVSGNFAIPHALFMRNLKASLGS